MATITKTIGSGGDYASCAAAASAFDAGTVSGASASDDIVFQLLENRTEQVSITTNTGSYASLHWTSNTAGTFRSWMTSTVNDANNASTIIKCSVSTLPVTYSWLNFTRSGSGKFHHAIGLAALSGSVTHTIRNCKFADNGRPNAGTVRAIGDTTGSIIPSNVNIMNCSVWNIKSAAGWGAYGIAGPTASGVVANILNVTVHDVDDSGSGTVNGILSANQANKTLKNVVVTKIGTATSGTKACFSGINTTTTRSDLASSDTTATGTGAITSISYASELVDADNGDFTPTSSGQLFQGGVDLVTTPTNVQFDLLNYDRDTTGATWSIGAYQEGNVPPDSITLNTPADYRIYQRDGSGNASVTLTGVYSSAGGGAIEYRYKGGAWTTLVASPSGGTFSQAVTLTAGQGSLEVRLAAATGVTDTAVYIGVGDIFLIAGQSNAEGRLTNDQTYSHATIKPVVYDENDTGWRDCVDPTDSESTDGSIWPLLATLLMADQSVPCGFITTASGGTGLTTDWKPTVTVGSKYTNAVNRVSAVGPNDIKAMIWDQGETDATNSVSGSDYNTALDNLAANLQTATGITFVTICDLVGYVSPAGTLDAIRDAQIDAWDDNADIYPGANSITRAGLHWTTDAEGATHAALLWVAMDEALYGGPSARGPRLSSAITISGTSTLTLTFDRDLLSSDTTYTSAAFTVSHSGTARTVSSVTRTGTRTVQLTLSGALDGSTPTVTFGSGLTAAGATVPRTTAISLPATINSISSISVPAEPIIAAAVTVNAPDTTAPVIAAASVNSAGTTLTVSFTEVDSPPLLPSSAATGITLSSTGASITVSNGTRQSDLVFTFPLSRTIYNNETLLVSYTQASGNITDSAVPSVNEVPTTSNFAVTNSSTQAPTITSVAVDAIVLVGTADTITWSSAGIIGNVDILLSLDNGSTFPIAIVSGTANDGSYSWTPEAAQITATGVVRVRSSSQTTIYDDQTVIVATTSGGTGAFAILAQAMADAGLELVVRT